ncbi:MAG TPA: hypothetical protein VEO01_00945 [Pseudonocardiaceae bacterium]|nr:hypothetical protein [Pseudonocardiaceae bacterium]
MANWAALPIRLRCALGIALAGGVLLAVGPLLPVVSPAMPPGFGSGPLMFVLGLLPVGVALVLAGRGSMPAARGALLAAALFAPGRAIADAQLAVQGSVAARPELMMPTALLRLHGATGLWLLLAGEVLILSAGLVAIGTTDPEPATHKSDRTSSGSEPLSGESALASTGFEPVSDRSGLVSGGSGSASGGSGLAFSESSPTAGESGSSAGGSGLTSGGLGQVSGQTGSASGEPDRAAGGSGLASGESGPTAGELGSAPGGSSPMSGGLEPVSGESGLAFGESGGAVGGLGSATGRLGSAAGESGRTSGGYQGPVLIALGLGVVVALGLMAVPFTSSTPFVLANGVLDAPIMALAGGLLIAVAAPLAAAIAVTSADPGAARGWLLGGQAVVLAIALPRVVSGLAVNGLHPNWGPYVAVVAALLLVALGLFAERVIRPAPDDDTDTAEPADLQLPGQSRLHVATGVLGLVAAGAALVGADTNLYVLSADLPHNTAVAGRLLVPAAVLIGVCAIGMLIPRWAFVVRPAFAVGWVSVLLAGFSAVDTAMTATQIDGVRLGIGTWATGLAMLGALAAACTAGLAGGVERDDVDLTELSWRPQVLVPAAAAAALAIGTFGLPVLQANGFTPPGLWSDFRFASWGLVFSLVAVLAAALLAPICRPARAVGLLLGAAGLVLVRLLSLPLDRSTVPGTGAGPGMLFAVACLIALLVAAGMAGWLAHGDRVKREAAKRAAAKRTAGKRAAAKPVRPANSARRR